jgi:thiosulfate/3-mercaptopyruvate sulfurtransferase
MSLAPVIDAATAAALANPLFVDCRFELADPAAGEAAYRAGHLPGAVYAHLDHDLSDHGSDLAHAGRHPLPTAAQFAARMSAWGWTPGRHVVAYDGAGGALAAARLWWLLVMARIPASVLDGGVKAWAAAGQPLSTDIPAPSNTHVDVAFDNDLLVDADELTHLMAENHAVLVDARARPRYLGEIEPIDAVAGHVPGALNRPFDQNLSDGRWRTSAELRQGFEALLGNRHPGDVVHMCGSGVTACHNILAMAQAGLGGSRLFAPSWSGWSSDPDRPVARG